MRYSQSSPGSSMHENILFLSKGERASSTRYRALQYFPYFKTHGWKPEHVTISGGVISVLRALNAARKADVVVLLRKTFPYPVFWLLRKLSKKLFFDFDDAIFCNTDGTDSKTRMNRFKTTVAACDYVFAGNSYLADTARQFNTAVSVIPTSLETKKYTASCDKESDVLCLVWIGSSSTRKYLEEILPQLEQACRKVKHLSLKVIADFELQSSDLNIKTIHWREESEALELCKSHIGIAPMPEDNWTKGKCALKVLQYMAAGLPVISSKSGVNADVIDHQINGYLISNHSEWRDVIEMYSKNTDALRRMGDLGQKKVRAEYDIEIVFEKLLRHIERAC